MNLIEKRIKQLKVGSKIEVLLSDGIKVSGQLTDRDDECIEIKNNAEENIIFIGEVKSVRLFMSSEDSENTSYGAEKTLSSAASAPKMSFLTEVKNIMASDAKLNTAFKELQKEERKFINTSFTSFMSAIRNKDMDRTLAVVNSLKRSVDSYGYKINFGENTYKLLGYMYSRCSMYDPELYIKGKCWDLASIAYYKSGNLEEAAACASISLDENPESENKEAVYTILYKTMSVLQDAGGIINAINKNPLIIGDKYMNELLAYVYEKNDKKFSSNVNTGMVISFLKSIMTNNTVLLMIRNKKGGACYTNQTEERRNGKIVKLLWSSEKGEIDSQGRIFRFKYSDIKDTQLSNKISQMFISDLESRGESISVEFDVKNGIVTSIRSKRQSHTQAQPLANQQEKEEKLNFLQIGRSINSRKDNEDRFHESLKFFQRSIDEGEHISESVIEAINCCLAIANNEDKNEYLQKAIELYEKYKDNFNGIGLQYNSIIYGLLTKLNRLEESLECVNRILQDTNLPSLTRMHFIDCRAGIYFSIAEKTGDLNMYEKAKNESRSWEQEYLSHKEEVGDSFKKMYYSIILYRIAYCLYKTGELGTSQQIIDNILKYDPENENAKNLNSLLRQEDSQDEEEEHEPETEEEVEQENEEESEQEVQEEEAVEEPESSEPAETAAAELYDESEFYQDYEYVDSSGWDALDLTESDVINYALGIKGENKVAISLAYLKAALLLNPKFENIYDTISLAVDNPMEILKYSMTDIIARCGESREPYRKLYDICYASSFVRSGFYGNTENVQFHCSDYFSEQVLKSFPSLKEIADIIDDFRINNGVLIDKYADYQNVNMDELELRHDNVVKEAVNVYERYFNRVFHEDKNQLRFKLTKSILFEKNGLPERMMYFVSNDDYEGFKEIEKEFREAFIRNGDDISISSIHGEKIDFAIDQAWKKAGDDKSVCERKSSDLMGSFRNNLYSPLNNCIKIVCEWVQLYENGCDLKNTENYAVYLEYKKQLLPLLEKLIDECQSLNPDDIQDTYGCAVLKELAKELICRLDGTWSYNRKKYYFCDFLRTDNILLDQNFMPEINSTFCDLPDFNVLKRIRDHAGDEKSTIIEHGKKIFSRDDESHDFGTAEMISEYLRYLNREEDWQIPENSSIFEEQAKKQMKSKLDKFNSDVCLAISRGQINKYDQFLNGIEAITHYWYQYCLESKNYGFFSRFVNSCMKKIQRDAVSCGERLLKQLSELVEDKKPEQKIIDTITDYIDKQFFTVAEDWMSRITKGDFDSESKPPLDAEECLKSFWNEFEEIYKTVFSSGYNLRKAIRKNIHVAKDRKGGEALINNWLDNGTKANSEKINTLLNLLGWENIDVVDESTDVKNEIYHIKYNSNYKGKNVYSHPIPAFGSVCRDSGFYVVCMYGYSDSKRLIDKYTELDNITGNKIILLDYALNASERRSLAKVVKQTPLMWTYMLIDRVTIMYIANHYISGGNNRTLMSITMPFSYLQPYVYESTYTIPPEMFIGRRDELLSIESPTGANLVYGGRQLGKSALLKKAQNEMHDPEAGRIALFVDINGLDIKASAEKVSGELLEKSIISQITDDWGELASQIKSGINSNSISYLLLMMDESDRFIDDCKNVNYQPLVCLKDIQQSLSSKFKFVMAGLHDIVKFHRSVALGNNSVISHFSSINITPFSYECGRELLTKPLSYLGFTFGGNETVISHILSTTNYFPGIIQLFGSKLIKSMKKYYYEYNESVTPPYNITESHIGKILTDKEFLFAVKNCFEMTLRLDEEYYIIAMIIAYLSFADEEKDGCTASDIFDNLKELEIKRFENHDIYQIETLLEELCDLNVLKRVNDRFSFRTKSFRDLLGTKKEVDDIVYSIISQ